MPLRPEEMVSCKSEKPCPNCGRCPTCGRSDPPVVSIPQIPYQWPWEWPRPWWEQPPFTYEFTCEGTTTDKNPQIGENTCQNDLQ
jgi:hypothetical protein